MVLLEDAPSDGVRRGLVIQPVIIVGVAEFRNIFGHVFEEQGVSGRHLDVLVALECVHDVREVCSPAGLGVILCMMQVEAVGVVVVTGGPRMDVPLAVAAPIVLRPLDVSGLRLISRQRRTEALLQLDVRDVLKPQQAVQVWAAATMVLLGGLFAGTVLEFQAREEVHHGALVPVACLAAQDMLAPTAVSPRLLLVGPRQ
eukprot:9504001-Pyramimonas_sp.AAC.7